MPERQASSGELLVILPRGSDTDPADLVLAATGARCVSSDKWNYETSVASSAERVAVIYPDLGVALTNTPRDVLEKAFGPERVARNFRLKLPTVAPFDQGDLVLRGSAHVTPKDWARQAVAGPTPGLDGHGVRVCVVDTGLKLDHPDFQDQGLDHHRLKPFTDSGVIDDEIGHGSHCAGIIGGDKKPDFGPPRYSIAPGARLYIANVFGDASITSVDKLIAALQWAKTAGCDIVSMSLFQETGDPDETEALKFREVLEEALNQGTALIACTGNSSDRGGGLPAAPASFPANVPGVLAVGGINEQMAMINNSNSGGSVVAPAELVWSAWHTDFGYKFLSGTSMAAACAAGVAALHAQKFPHLRGRDLLRQVLQSAQPLNLPPADVGRGLVKAP